MTQHITTLRQWADALGGTKAAHTHVSQYGFDMTYQRFHQLIAAGKISPKLTLIFRKASDAKNLPFPDEWIAFEPVGNGSATREVAA